MLTRKGLAGLGGFNTNYNNIKRRADGSDGDGGKETKLRAIISNQPNPTKRLIDDCGKWAEWALGMSCRIEHDRIMGRVTLRHETLLAIFVLFVDGLFSFTGLFYIATMRENEVMLRCCARGWLSILEYIRIFRNGYVLHQQLEAKGTSRARTNESM